MEKKPFLTESMAQDIIQDVPTPFHVYDEKGIRENARRINKAFSWNKGFREYFAVKALPNPVILQILKEEGCGVDCSSLTELMLSEVCGFSGSDIMFSSNQTPVEDMKKAYELGAYINLDDATMVDFLDRVAGVPENIFCRYNPGGTFQLGESKEGFQVMDKPGDAKYGMSEVLGPAVFSDENDEVFLGKDFGHVNNYSEATSAKIDAEIERMMRHAYSQTEEILKTHYEKLELVAETLLQKEKITGEMFAQLMENGKLDEPEAQPTEEPESPAAETQTAADTAPVPAPEDGDAPAAEAANAPADPAPEAPKSDQ